MTPGKTTSKKPQQAVLNKLPPIKKPLEHIGKLIKVPGSFWEGQLSASEKARPLTDGGHFHSNADAM